MRYRAVIFDLDGVICHTDRFHSMAWAEIARELGVPYDWRISNRMRGIDRMASLEVLLESSGTSFSDEEKTVLADKKNRIYRNLLNNLSEKDLDPDVVRMLDGVRAAGLKMAIGSSSKNAKFILCRLGLASFFDAVSDGTNASRSKPDPEIFLAAAEMMAVSPRDCLVVEDATSGLLAARAAGMAAAAIGDAADPRLADHVLDRPSDLLDIVQSPEPSKSGSDGSEGGER